jgi:hypothetical protein
VALPIWDNRLSPVLDTAGTLLVVDIEAGDEIGRREWPLTAAPLPDRLRQLIATQADVLLCGAVSDPLRALLAATSLEVHPFLCGDAELVLEAFRSGTLTDSRFLMPGCCRWRGGRESPAHRARDVRSGRERGGGCQGGRQRSRRSQR